ncbi:MAG: monovalent cation/H(+) antiporter subunit G [Desulfuromonadales bacterium]|nr:monovalent cation/H(+) antiporter subunit G [Desulfuromonadales bacterium]
MNWLVTLLMVSGVFFFAIGTIGILRLPDFYSRLHAAGKCDTLAATLAVSAIALYNLHDLSFASILVSWKVFFIVFFIFMASPTATHAITKAALIVGVEPWQRKGTRK